MEKLKTTIDWEAQGILSQIADEINKPLTRLVQLIELIKSKKDMSEFETNQLSTIMLESSDQIEALIADIVKAEENKRIEILVHDKFKYPALYTFDEVSLNASNNLITQLNEKPGHRISQADIEWLLQLETTILNNIDSYALCVPWLAGELAVSERQIFRKIEKFTGMTPNKYIRNIKLFHAKKLLEKYTYSTVNEVACAVGMKDPYYFSSLYKKEFGKKPKEYLR
jgi:AraC-type DNA-binding domain-containing proteins